MLMIEYRDLGWRYWLATVCLLTAGLAGQPLAFVLAVGLTLVHLAHFLLRERSLRSFPVQVRLGYLVLLLLALPEPLQWIFWIPTVGTWAQVLFGYCTMARLVSLLPWNRSEPFSLRLVGRTFSAPPVRGNILQGLAPLSPGN